MNESIKLATVTGIGAGGGVLLRFDGEETARQKEYAYINEPSEGDRVCLLEISGSWIVFGSIGGGGGGGLPTGAIISFGGSTAPTGWLLCDGSAISRTEYANLFSAIGTAYGGGDGSTTFLLPDLRGRVPVGQDGSAEFSSLGQTGGEKAHSLTEAENGEHTHTQNSHTHTQDPHTHTQDAHNHDLSAYVVTTNISRAGTEGSSSYKLYSVSSHIGETEDTRVTNWNTTATNQSTRATNYNSGDGDPHNNLQPYTVVNHIIKA